MRLTKLAPLALLMLAAPIAAQETPAPAPAPAAKAPKPKLIVLISVDQFSADLFQEYRNRFTGGFKRLLDGAVFPSGYQSHAATETCPGHSTLMTGDRPTRTGIIANDWVDWKSVRPGPVYCAEDESKGTFGNYVASDMKLKVPTLGERMKDADPDVRTVSIAGKDRAAIMMGGHKIDQLWFWRDGKGFISYEGRSEPASVTAANAAAMAEIAKPGAAYAEPTWCKPVDRPIVANGQTVGAGKFDRGAKMEAKWKASPAFDTAVTNLTIAMIRDMKLGQGKSTDILTIGESATDYVGHTYGTEGSEMCIQLANLDQTLGKLFAALDKTGVDYVVALSADHGGNDIPERERERAMPMADRVAASLSPKAVGAVIAKDMGLTGQLLYGVTNGDVYLDPKLTGDTRAKVLAAAVARYRADPQVAMVLTQDEISAIPIPTGTPESWTMAERERASFEPTRSGDFVVFLKSRITAIPPSGYPGAVATHGSPWDYDRRVPILFWRKGMQGFEQPLSIETIDIMPSLAALVGFPLKPGDVDGRCLDLDGGVGDTCK
jgi:predicted AlkP superfamily pyrophosphatase or phosphodiesterase